MSELSKAFAKGFRVWVIVLEGCEESGWPGWPCVVVAVVSSLAFSPVFLKQCQSNRRDFPIQGTAHAMCIARFVMQSTCTQPLSGPPSGFISAHGFAIGKVRGCTLPTTWQE